MAETQERTPRTYADLLALYQASAPWEPPPPDQPVAVADQLEFATELEIARALKIDVLGRTETGEVECYSEHYRRCVILNNVSRMRYGDMILAFGSPVKSSILKSGYDEVPGMFSLGDARDAISALGGQRVLTDETKLGPGCWPVCDENGDEQDAVILVNSHEAVVYNGKVERITHPRYQAHLLAFEAADRAWYDYDELCEYLRQCESTDWRSGVVDELCKLFCRWRWRGHQISMIVFGLIMATWVQSLWAWRPRVDVLGASGSGKSMFCEALCGLFRGLVISTADTSFPGLAQEMQRRMAAVIVDEIDAKDRESAARQRQIIKGLRSASRGTVRIRGTGGQKATRFTLRHLAWVAGISMNYDDQADRNRAIILSLDLPTSAMSGKLRLPQVGELNALGQKSLAVALWCIRIARRRAVGLKDVKLDGVDQRAVESYAVPAAMVSVAMGYNDEFAVDLLRDMLDGVGADSPVEIDERTLIAEILGATVQLESYRLTVGQVIEMVVNDLTASNRDEWRKVLESSGIKLYLGAVPQIAFRYQAVRSKLLHYTKWAEHPIDQFLRRIVGVEVRNIRIGGAKGYSAVYPLREFMETFVGGDEDESVSAKEEKGAF